MTTQVQRIGDHLRAGKSITPALALTVYSIYRLSSVIEDLRATGMAIDCLIKYDETGKQYGEYRLRRPIKVGQQVQVVRGAGIGLPNWVRRQKLAEVMQKEGDASLVYFVRGKRTGSYWLNDKELQRAD